jgi:hypothetical protein
MNEDTTPKSEGHLKGWKLVRPPLKEGQCPLCLATHHPDQPHNQQSLFYQYSFYEGHGVWPTWADAMAHCTPEVKKLWTDELAKEGIVVPTC